MFEEKMSFTAKDDEGREVECEVLFTFESDKTHRNYIVFTDNSVDENGNTRVFANIYEPDSEETELRPIETDAEWEAIETILEAIQNEVNGSR